MSVQTLHNKNRYVAFKLPEDLVGELYEIGLWIRDNNPDITFIPMDYEQIHMTVCFLGELSKNLIGNKKQKIQEIEQAINDFPEINQVIFDKYELFSVKQNLIVAKFIISEETKKKIIKFKKQFVQYGAPNEDFYVPHCTLGKIMNCNENTVFTTECCSSIPRITITELHHLKCKLV
jgi:2'-5' RNA ligase